MIASIVTVCGRPWALRRSLPQILKTGDPVLVVDDSRTDADADACREVVSKVGEALYMRVPQNRGLACAMNLGLDFWLADEEVKWISYFQEDVDVDSHAHKYLALVGENSRHRILTGRDAREHATVQEETVMGVRLKLKKSTAGTHLFAARNYWMSVYPIPTRRLGAPMPLPGQARGLGSNVDWWICTRAPRSAAALGGFVACAPGFVRTFLIKKSESCWDNEHLAGEDPLLPERPK